MDTVESIIENIFHIYINPNKKTNANWTLIESDDFDGINELAVDHLDTILLYQLTEVVELSFYDNNPFKYLNNCFNESSNFLKKYTTNTTSGNASDIKNQQQLMLIDTVVSCRNSICDYGLILFQIDDFTQYGNQLNIVQYIIENLNDCNDFLINIINKAIENDDLLTMCNTIFDKYMEYINNNELDMNDPLLYNQVLNFMEFFCSFKPIGSIFTKLTSFDPFNIANNYKLNKQDNLKIPFIEQKSLLATILKISPLQKKVSSQAYKIYSMYDENDIRLDKSIERSINEVHETLQMEHNTIINKLFSILNKLFRSSSETRIQLLKWLSSIVNKNHLRRGDHHDSRQLSSNAFMCNISLILIRFSLPFLDVGYTKLNKIDMEYFKHHNDILIDIDDESKMNSDLNEYKNDYCGSEDSISATKYDPNFISECFYLSCTYLHYGIGGAILDDSILEKKIKHFKDELIKVNHMIDSKRRESNTGANSSGMNNTFVVNMFEQTKQKLQSQLNEMRCSRLSFQGFSIHTFLQTDVFNFICGVSTYLIRVIDPTKNYPATQIKLPLLPDQLGVENVDNFEYLRSNAPKPFKYYPEFMVEGLINYCQYINRYYKSPMINNPRLCSFLELCTVLLRCPELISNPHLKAKIILSISTGCTPQRTSTPRGGDDEDEMEDEDDEIGSTIPGFMMEVIETDELCLNHLLFSLLDFYVIVEKTGSSSQFYDKFNSRFYISVILEQIYKKPYYKKNLLSLVETNLDFFTRFVARMLNDLTFLLDEAFTSLLEVHDCYIEIQKRRRGEQPSNRQREESIEQLENRFLNAGSKAKSSCGLANKSMNLFKVFTRDLPFAFTIPEIVDRLASMLNFNLKILVGPKCNNLIVKNPEKYSFEPKKLLKNLCSIYMNLSNEENFIMAVSKDERSFDKQLFYQAIINLYNRLKIVDSEFAENMTKFVENVLEQKLNNEEEDLNLNDCPDEFLDPLMYTIMKDPVVLPTSKVIIDRSTIKQHLLSDSTDPFNRSPLKLEDVIPATELKQKIDEYKKSKKSK